MEAAIVFGRVAIHRVHNAAEKKSKSDPDTKAEVDKWWKSLLGNPAIEFFSTKRDLILKEGPPKVGQIIWVGAPENLKAEQLYYYDDPALPATATIEQHLNSVEKIVADAENRFGTATLLGRW